MNFEGFTNSASAPRTTLHKTRNGFTVLFPTIEVKPNSKYTLQNTCISYRLWFTACGLLHLGFRQETC